MDRVIEAIFQLERGRSFVRWNLPLSISSFRHSYSHFLHLEFGQEKRWCGPGRVRRPRWCFSRWFFAAWFLPICNLSKLAGEGTLRTLLMLLWPMRQVIIMRGREKVKLTLNVIETSSWVFITLYLIFTAFSLFNVVQFENAPCASTQTISG